MKKPRKPISEQGKPGKYDIRNKLNDLTGKDWLMLTASYWFSEASSEDKVSYKHPAPFLVKDIEKLISFFTKKGMTVLDPFVGSGTTLVAANKLGRHAIGIDLNPEYLHIAEERLSQYGYHDYKCILGDASTELDAISEVDYIVTSPPYHNILRNDSKGTRHLNGKQYRMSAREGVIFYSDYGNDLGNCSDYPMFLEKLLIVMEKLYLSLKNRHYCSIIISDFTVDKKEMSVTSDIIRLMIQSGFQYCGTTVLIQTVKPLYPFGYPYAYKINHHHQNIITFRKIVE